LNSTTFIVYSYEANNFLSRLGESHTRLFCIPISKIHFSLFHI
jgi:hypothetical protein